MARLGSVALAVFVLGGVLRALPLMDRLPADIIAVAGVVTVAACAIAVRHHGLPTTVRVPLGLFALLGVSLLWSPPTTVYGVEKVLHLFTLTLLAATAPAVLIRTQESLRWFLGALVVIGLGAVVLTFVADPTEHGRLVAAESNPIWTSRAIGVATVIALTYALPTKSSWAWLIALVGAAAMLSNGARGPLVGLVVAGGLLVGYAVSTMPRNFSARAPLYAGLALLTAVVVYGVAAFAPEAVDRVGEGIREDEVRQVMYSQTLRLAASAPLGVGWGEWTAHTSAPDEFYYPHNIVLEVAVEAGWLAAVALVTLLIVVGRRLWFMRGDMLARCVLGLLLFTVTAAMFSGDVNNRPLWAIVAVGLTVSGPVRGHIQPRAALRNRLAG